LANTAFWGFLGVNMVLPIGGADMPVVVSLLNAFSGLATSAAGFMLSNDLLTISGAKKMKLVKNCTKHCSFKAGILQMT